MKNKLVFKLGIQMLLVVLIIAAVFYFIISMQARQLEQGVLDKAKLFSSILGLHLDRIISDNLDAYSRLQQAVVNLTRGQDQIENIRIISPEFTILVSNLKDEIWQKADAAEIKILKEVLDKKTEQSKTEKLLGKDRIIHYLPLFSGDKGVAKGSLIGVLELGVRFPSQQAQVMAYLRTNMSVYFKQEATAMAHALSDSLRDVLNQVRRNSQYLNVLTENIREDTDIQDIKVLSRDLILLETADVAKALSFIDVKENSLYREVMRKETAISARSSPGGKNIMEVVSPLYALNSGKKHVDGVVGVTISLDRVAALVRERRNNILFMSLVIIVMFFVLIGMFFRVAVLAPVKQLGDMAAKVGQGDFSQRVRLNAKDEIGELAESFNRMSTELERSKKEIEDWNLHLQDKVQKISRELEEKQAKLTETQRMASLGILSSGIAHEINNPLNIILGHTQMLLKEVRGNNGLRDAEETKRLLGIIEEYTKRCAHIVQSLLQFAQKKEVYFRETDLRAALENAIMFTSSRLAKKNVEMRKEIAGNLPQIQADGVQLEQVFINIILNAEQSTPDDGTISVRAGLDSRCENIEIVFTDTGSGIDEEDLKRIFDPFFTTRSPGEGVGLGLSISYGIIKNHGGDIKVESVFGQGTTFAIHLPVKIDK